MNTTQNNNWCHPDWKIDEYLSKASVELWTIQAKVDLSKYDEPPVYYITELEEKKMLNKGYL